MSSGTGSGDYTGFDIEKHHSGAFSVLILCYLEIYLYQCPVGLVLVITQDLTKKMHNCDAFSVLIFCYLEIYLYQCPVGLALVITQDLT